MSVFRADLGFNMYNQHSFWITKKKETFFIRSSKSERHENVATISKLLHLIVQQ